MPLAKQAAPPSPYSKPTVEGEGGGSQGLGDWYTRPYKRRQVTSPSPLMKHTGTPHRGGRTLAILRRLTTAREAVLTLVWVMELLVYKRKNHAEVPTSRVTQLWCRNNVALASMQSARGDGEQTAD